MTNQASGDFGAWPSAALADAENLAVATGHADIVADRHDDVRRPRKRKRLAAAVTAAVVLLGVAVALMSTRAHRHNTDAPVAVEFPGSIDGYQRTQEQDGMDLTYLAGRAQSGDPALAQARLAEYTNGDTAAIIAFGIFPAEVSERDKAAQTALVRRIDKGWWRGDFDLKPQPTTDGQWWCSTGPPFCVGVDKTSFVLVQVMGADSDDAASLAFAADARKAIEQMR